jgi:hypothetical protein
MGFAQSAGGKRQRDIFLYIPGVNKRVGPKGVSLLGNDWQGKADCQSHKMEGLMD